MKNEKERKENLILNEETSGAEVLSTSDSKKAATPKLGITIAVVLVLVVIMSVALVACSKKNNNKNNQVTNNTPKVEVESTEEVQVPEVEVEAEPEPEVEVETTEEVVEEPVTEQTMEEWLTEIGSQGTICMAVWNDVNSTKHIIENDETYELQNGDRFFICTPSKIKKNTWTMRIKKENGERVDNYMEVVFQGLTDKEDITCETTCAGGEQGIIHFTLLCSGTSDSDKMLGLHWATKLGYDVSKMVVWNDTTGLKQELEEGATYQLCEGDQLALYIADEYFVDSKNIETSNTKTTANILFIYWEQIELGDKFDLEITTRHVETLEAVTSHVTLLPVQ